MFVTQGPIDENLKMISILQADRQTNRQTNKQTNRQTDRQTHRQTQTDRHRQTALKCVSSLVCDAGGLPHCFHVLTKT